MRKAIYIAGGVIVLLVIVIVVLPFLIDANQFRPKIESAMDSSLNRKVEIGNIKLSIFSGGVSVDGVTISDDLAFGREPFLKAKSVTVGVELIPLIFSREVRVTAFSIDDPELTLLRSASGKWNFSTLGATASKPKAADEPSSETNVSVQRLTMNNGKLVVGNLGSSGKRHEYSAVNLEASNLSYTTQFPFKLTAKTPGNGSLKLEGKAGPLNRVDAEETPVDARLEVRNLDLASTGFIDPSSGIAGLLDFTGNLNSNGQRMTSRGKVNATRLQLVQGSSPAREPVQIDYDTDYELKPQTGVLKQGDVHIGKALARLTGTYHTAGEITSVQMKLNGENMPAQDLESLLPALGVILPSGASLQGGTLNANLATSGPVNRLVTSGPVNLSNSKLAGFDLGSKMGAVGAFAGLKKGADTEIQTFSSDLRVAPEGIRADNLNLIVPAIGNLTGNGTIASDHALDFKMVARLTNTGTALGVIGNVMGGGQKGSGIPFMIHGTTSNPVFVPDVGGMVGGLTKGMPNTVPTQQDVGGLLQGLMGKKKKP
ncbi:MAG: AsmA family protein [Candidatus Acidiferrales bacterium]